MYNRSSSVTKPRTCYGICVKIPLDDIHLATNTSNFLIHLRNHLERLHLNQSFQFGSTEPGVGLCWSQHNGM
ncbi:uncharacterized protein V6R79_017277, partial [Siganus canaliculatus]